MTFEERLRGTLEAEADAYRHGELDWPAVVRGVERRRRRQRVALGVFIAALFSAGAAFAAVAIGDNSPDPTGTAGPPSSDRESNEAPETTTAIPPAARPPGFAAALRPDGRLVLVDASTGEEIRELAYEGSPSDKVGEGGPMFIDSVSVAPDRRSLYYTTCCEPAVGSVHSMSVEGGEATNVGDGAPVAIGPDGTTAAVDPRVGIKLYPPTPPHQHFANVEIVPIEPGPDDPEVAVDVAWDAFGRRLVVGLDHGTSGPRVAVVTLVDDGERTIDLLTPDTGAAWSHPRFGPGGLIYVIESRDGYASVLRSLDREGEDRGTIDLGGRAPQSIGSDHTAAWLVVGLKGGGIVTIDPDEQTGLVKGAGEYVWIDW